MRCGLLGRKLGHSYSPQIHSQLADYSYALIEKEPDELDTFFKDLTFHGLNVTIPYKKDVIRYCDALSENAQKLGAVNTIVRSDDGRLVGYNTDYYGFYSMIEKTGLSLMGKKVLVLGSGGAAATAMVVLRELGANAFTISRSGADNYTNLERHADASVIVNATPVGMYPQPDISPVDLSLFPELEGVLDMIYNPAHTRLLQQAEARNLVAENGLWMLVAQAKKSAELFMHKAIDAKIIADIHRKLQNQMQNLILIGMPGSGKTTIGSELAERTGREFVDSDAQIVQKAGMSIPEIFAKHGESVFRQYETRVLSALGMQSGLIIATGGGCVTQEENYAHLHQNGKIIWIKRDINALPTNGRPLSQSGNLEVMFAQRCPLYERFADLIVENEADVSNSVNTILSSLDMEA